MIAEKHGIFFSFLFLSCLVLSFLFFSFLFFSFLFCSLLCFADKTGPFTLQSLRHKGVHTFRHILQRRV